jgi:hypothetical protein
MEPQIPVGFKHWMFRQNVKDFSSRRYRLKEKNVIRHPSFFIKKKIQEKTGSFRYSVCGIYSFEHSRM